MWLTKTFLEDFDSCCTDFPAVYITKVYDNLQARTSRLIYHYFPNVEVEMAHHRETFLRNQYFFSIPDPSSFSDWFALEVEINEEVAVEKWSIVEKGNWPKCMKTRKKYRVNLARVRNIAMRKVLKIDKLYLYN